MESNYFYSRSVPPEIIARKQLSTGILSASPVYVAPKAKELSASQLNVWCHNFQKFLVC